MSVKAVDIKDLIVLQKLTIDRIKNMRTNYGKDSKARKTKQYIKNKIESLYEEWETFKTNHQNITLEFSAEDSKLDYFKNDLYGESRELYVLFLSELEQYQEESFGVPVRNPAPEETNNDDNQRPKLPAINLPKFTGDYRTWTSFHDLFVTLIHNNKKIPDVQKLYYLKTHLMDEAEQLLRHVSITEVNYKTAWETLIQRYENKRVLVNNQLRVLLSQTNIPSESSEDIKALLDNTSECLQALQNLGIDVKSWDPLIIYIISQKLPSETHQLWEQGIGKIKDLPTFDQLKEFLESRFRTLEVVGTLKCKGKPPLNSTQRAQNSSYRSKQQQVKTFHLMPTNKCCYCSGQHSIRQCSNYQNLGASEREDIAINKGLCLNCLTKGHHVKRCFSKRNCRDCGGRHHYLLHRSGKTKEIVTTTKQSSTDSNKNMLSSSQPNLTTASLHGRISTNILLATVMVKVTSPSGTHRLRALLDQGSQTSFITESAVQLLGLHKERITATVTGIGCDIKEFCRNKVKIHINSLKNECSIEVEALVLRTITNLLPNSPITNQHWPHLEGLELADPNFVLPGKIDILLGADVYAEILINGLKKGPPKSPIAQNTIFGWVISGRTSISEDLPKERVKVSNFHNRIQLDKLLQKFWEIEEVQRSKLLTKEDILCEEIFKKTHSRDMKGRYIVQLPFKDEQSQSYLGKSRNIALARFKQTERRFTLDPKLKSDYSNCIKEYLALDHMKEIDISEEELCINKYGKSYYTCFYLPHHPVIKVESSTTKLRIVFNASQSTTSGNSLNDMLLTGPTIQDDLKTILLRWRAFKYVYSADIEKMYRQIKVCKQHQHFQRLVWRDNADEEIKDFYLKRVTFGFTSAAFLAIRSLKQLALDEGENFPLGKDILLNEFYVDNVLSGSDTIHQVIEQRKQLINLLEAGGFPLRKWSANHPNIIAELPEDYKEMSKSKDIVITDSIKTLGLRWNPKNDCFTYQLTLDLVESGITKRIIASIIAKIFDPLGWCAPIIIVGKIILQGLWLIEVDWDTELPPQIVQEFIRYRDSLADINTIQIPRWVGTFSASMYEIHGFCDASTKAYAAVLYLKILDETLGQKIYLLTASTKVAPIKTISLPRLELCGALLLARICNYTLAAMKTKPSAVYTWTDSNIVLSWLNGHPNKWKCFVANRVTEIKSLTVGSTWQHVPSAENPADCATRGLSPAELKKHNLWWYGPSWLEKNKKFWPHSSFTETTEEVKNAQILTTQTSQLPSFLIKFSKLRTLIRVTAYVLRFITNCRRKLDAANTIWLSPTELDSAFTLIVKQNQMMEFANEIQTLQNKMNMPKTSRLIRLHPFIDTTGLLRVGGRIQKSDLPYESKHPLILSAKSYLTELIIRHTHIELLHAGPQLTLNNLRQRFWILNARNTIRYQINRCCVCIKQKGVAEKQLMGSLPKARITQSRPFSHTGVDYCGPYNVRLSPGRGTKSQKCYIAIFICLAVKAIHIELVSDLTTQGFLAASRRFTSRRGLPSNMYSDCGTNFIGASRVLDKDLENFINSMQKEVAATIANDNITWHFNPPAAPNFGGLWEAGVKSTKYHLKRLLGPRLLTFQEMSTILTQIEAMLNSRPISPITNDIEDATALTPGHFLIGTPLKNVPETSLLEIKENYLSRWQLVQQITQHFWRRWHLEYINQLQQRTKWTDQHDNINNGDLILIKESNMPPNTWMLGRVVKTYPGVDNLTRVVDVKTKNGLLKRPISKIIKLPTEEESKCETPNSAE